MAPFSNGRTSTVSTWPAEAHGLLRWVSTNNPFYVVSAGLFLAGLWLSFGDPEQKEDTWLLMAGLTGYTFLLAGTAVLLIRFARVWDDARTVLLLIVLMFLATSVTFDRVLVFNARFPEQVRVPGWLFNLVSLLLAVAASEGVLRAVHLKLPAVYRAPYYLLLAVFFLYPVLLTWLLDRANPRGPGIMWGLFGFSSAAAAVFLTLVPAIRRGKEALRDNGSPWPWPLYPWALFAVLGLAVPGRAILLCYSMHLIDVANLYDMTFGPYFLVPFGLVLCVLLLEAGIVTERPGLLGGALALPMVLLGMSLIGHRSETIYQQFLAMFTRDIGADPVYCTIVASAAFYLYAALRRAPWAMEALAGAIAVLTFVGPNVLKAPDFTEPQPGPMMVAAITLIGLGVWRRGSWRCFVGSCGLALGVALIIPPGVDLSPYRVPIAFHILFAAMLLIGWAFDDDLGKALRFIGPSLALLACLALMLLPIRPPAGLPAWVLSFYPLAMAILLAAYGFLMWNPPIMIIAAVILLSWTGASGWHIYRMMRALIIGLDYLVLSFLVFALAILVSLAKSRVLSRWRPADPEDTAD